LCTVGTADYSVGSEYIGGRGSVVTGWRRIGGGNEDREERMRRAERVVGRENNGL
jgi:hypothetical protein